jgi:hypothetical protein
MKKILSFIFVSILPLSIWAQPTISGKVRDKKTNEPLIGAVLKFRQNGEVIKGARTNTDGGYKLALAAGRYTVEVSYVGYESTTEEVALALSIEKNFTISEGSVTASEVIIDAGEDLATTVIKRAIRYKRRQRDALKTYQVEGYAKRAFKADTSIAGISETFANGYWRKGDTLREVIIQERITENVKADLKRFTSGGSGILPVGLRTLIDFTRERILTQGNKIISPIADDALEFYKYKLIETKKAGTIEYYRLKLIPQSKYVPLFNGEIKIAGETYALVEADVMPSAGFQIPYTDELSIRYRQAQELQTDSAGNGAWLPVNQVIDVAVKISIAGGFVELPRIEFTQTTAINHYKINVPVPDSLFVQKLTQKSDEAKTFDSTFWAQREFVTMTEKEAEAFKNLDSTKSLADSFKPRGLGGSMISNGAKSSGINLFDLPKVRYNRVEGLFLGLHLELDSILKTNNEFRVGFGYGISNKDWRWNAGYTHWFDKRRDYGLSLDAYRATTFSPELESPWDTQVALSFLSFKDDYHNYFRADGWKAAFLYEPRFNFRSQIGYRSEMHRDMREVQDFSLFYRNDPLRPNPVIKEGNMRSIFLRSVYGNRAYPIGLFSPVWAMVDIEHSSNAIGSDFEFTRVWGSFAFKKSTFFTERLLAPYLLMQFEAGSLLGAEKPVQRLFSADVPVGFLASSLTMLAARQKELIGTSMASVVAEHNFQSIPFQVLGLDFISKHFIQIYVRGGAARLWNGNSASNFYETGFGFGGLFGIARTNFMWGFRENRSPEFRFSMGMGILF